MTIVTNFPSLISLLPVLLSARWTAIKVKRNRWIPFTSRIKNYSFYLYDMKFLSLFNPLCLSFYLDFDQKFSLINNFVSCVAEESRDLSRTRCVILPPR